MITGDVIEGFQVQPNGSPNMTVIIGQGSAGIGTGTYPSSFKYWIANNTTTGTPAGESVTIPTANASNPFIATIVVYVNESTTFNTSPVNFPGGWTAVAVAGTPNASPSAPNTAAIQAAVGAGNPYIILANVLVGTSVTQINAGNITDLRTFIKPNASTTLPSNQLSNPYKFNVYENGPIGSWSTAGAFKTVPFDTKMVDTSSNYNTSTSTFTVPVTGNYSLGAGCTLNNATNAFLMQLVILDGATTVVSSPFFQGSGIGNTTATASIPMVPLTAGDLITVQVYGNTGTWGLVNLDFAW